MYVKTHFKTISPTQEIIEKVRTAARGGEEVMERAELRPVDEQWWTDATNGIIESLEKTLILQSVPAEEIIACIPESEFKRCYSERDKERVREKHLVNARKGGAWVLTVGMLLRDTERLQVEALGRGNRVIQARGELRAFAVVIAMALGCASIGKSSSYDYDDEHLDDE
jgi:hypothetical protein